MLVSHLQKGDSLSSSPGGLSLDSLKAVSYVHWNASDGWFLEAKANAQVVKTAAKSLKGSVCSCRVFVFLSMVNSCFVLCRSLRCGICLTDDRKPSLQNSLPNRERIS